jgi:predicted phosphodiesterase
MPFGVDDLTFFVISDTQAEMIPGLLKTDQTRQKMVIEAMLRDSSIPDFFINCGDHVQSDTLPEWTDYFQTIFPLARKTAVFPVMGNHEDMSEYYFKAFSFPNGGGYKGWEWYSFRVENALFIFLNTNFRDLDHINKQIDWLKSTLGQQGKKTWKFVFCHHPLYSSGRKYGGSESTFASLLEPIFVRYGIDVVFSGHHHAYQRIHRNGIHYIVSAGGGGSFSRLRKRKIEGTIKTHEKALHYLRIRIVKNEFTMEMRTVGQENAEGVIDLRDEIFDHLEIVKR